jgi:hypothetical protein
MIYSGDFSKVYESKMDHIPIPGTVYGSPELSKRRGLTLPIHFSGR